MIDPIYDNTRLYRIRKETEDIKDGEKRISIGQTLVLAIRKQITVLFLIIKMVNGMRVSLQRITLSH